MSKYVADRRFISSIYPGQMEPLARNYGVSVAGDGRGAVRSTTFTLEPVPRGGKPFVLEIFDSFESVLDVMNIRPGMKGEKPMLSKPVPCEIIVADLLGHWTGNLHNVPQGAKPGIMEIANTLPSKAEMADLEKTQTWYFEYLFSEGERLHAQNAWKEITESMRLAAQWLGQSRVWSDPAIARSSSPCPFCTQMIPQMAIVCPFCRMTVKEIPAALAKLQAQPGIKPAA